MYACKLFSALQCDILVESVIHGFMTERVRRLFEGNNTSVLGVLSINARNLINGVLYLVFHPRGDNTIAEPSQITDARIYGIRNTS